jgi:predicted helicase
LANDPLYRSEVVRSWVWDDWPGRWGPDAGIDVVAEDRLGRLWAIQCKAYGPAHAVTKADVDSFMSESNRPKFSYRLLIATTDRLSATARRIIEAQEKQVGFAGLSALEATEIDWPRTPDDLRAQPPKRKRLRPHQRQAVRDLHRGFATHDRGQLVMACGTGKTLVATLHLVGSASEGQMGIGSSRLAFDWLSEPIRGLGALHLANQVEPQGGLPPAP